MPKRAPAPKPGKTAFDSLAGYVRALCDAWVDGGRTQAALAEKVGLSTGYLSLLRSEDRGIGFKAAHGFARAFNITYSDLEQRALAWEKARRPKVTLDGVGPGAIQASAP